MAGPGQPKTGGREKGTPNQITRELRELIREALDQEGGVEYLRRAAREHPGAFLALIAKLLPSEFKGSLESGPVQIHVVTGIDGAPGSRWAGNCKAEQRRKAALGPGDPPSEPSDASVELAKSSVVEMENTKPELDDKPQLQPWVPLRPVRDNRQKVALVD